MNEVKIYNTIQYKWIMDGGSVVYSGKGRLLPIRLARRASILNVSHDMHCLTQKAVLHGGSSYYVAQ